MVENWVKRTPDNFRFTAKFPKVITHDKLLVVVEEYVERFLENIVHAYSGSLVNTDVLSSRP